MFSLKKTCVNESLGANKKRVPQKTLPRKYVLTMSIKS